MRILRLLPLLLVLLLAACGTPEPAAVDPENPPEALLAALDSATVRAPLEILSADSLEGRGTGQPGEAKAVAYIADQMRQAGLQPAGDDGTFFQKVPLLGATPSPKGPLTFTHQDGQRLSLDFIEGFIASTDLEAEEVNTTGELVFVGYGIDAPGYDWHSFKDVDVTGKILVAFVNDPVATDAEPNRFQADTLTYYGRWTYKYEEARRRGAKGALLIHTLETAGYPFQVLSGTAAGEQIQLATPPDNPLELKGWITQDAAEMLAQMAGASLDQWFAQANDRAFVPQALPVSAALDVAYAVRRFEGTNVAGMIPGAARPDESVVFTAHHDHLGLGAPDETGDAIYNGAVDNASGVAMLLTLAKAFAQAPTPPDRSILFLSVTAEESGLLGATYYARHPRLPLSQAAGNVNVDSGNVHGRTTDIVGIGAEKSQMMDVLRDAAAAEGLSVTLDPLPNQGLFFRSDQLAFARAGVPAVFLKTGASFVGQPADYGARIQETYNLNHYHQPSDEFDPSWPMGGLVQQMRVAARLAFRLAYSDLALQWNEGEAFAQARAATP